MEDSDWRWGELDIDILVRIFQLLSLNELTSGIAHVCSTWRMAACDPILWKTLDLTMLQSNFIKIPHHPFVYVDTNSDKTLTRLLKISLSLSRESVTTLSFHFNLYLTNEQFSYSAERCPRLKRLVLPAWNRITKNAMQKAIRTWVDLETLTMPSIANPRYVLEEIGNNCKNFSKLKVMGPCDALFGSSLTSCLPNLKVLSLRCTMIHKDALIIILDGLRSLQVLNISHSLLMEGKRVSRELDDSILKRARRLKKFITCMDDSCIMCQRTRNDEGLLRWYKYEEGIWKDDEVKAFAF